MRRSEVPHIVGSALVVIIIVTVSYTADCKLLQGSHFGGRRKRVPAVLTFYTYFDIVYVMYFFFFARSNCTIRNYF